MKNILIVGGGICGLVIAKELSEAGQKVILLEAKDRVGGRIQTIRDKFSYPVDAGAEFIHGNLPHTKALLREAGIKAHLREGKTYKSKGSTIYATSDFIEDLDLVLDKLNKLEEDIPFSEFLAKYNFDDQTRIAVTNFAEGFDAADINRLSSFSIRDEWEKENNSQTLQIKEGHDILIKHLFEQCIEKGCTVVLNAEVKEIIWKKNHVSISCVNEQIFEANKVAITVSLGVFTGLNEKGYIHFMPAIPDRMEAAKQIGFGSAIKVIMEFKTAFWNNKSFESEAPQLPEMDFLIGESLFSVWWTHPVDGTPIITAWLGGPKVELLKDYSEEIILTKAVASLAATLKTTKNFLDDQLLAWEVANWSNDPYAKGAYSFNTVASKSAKKTLATPIEQTIYFAGEAINDGDSIGTVESAITSAMQTVKKMLT